MTTPQTITQKILQRADIATIVRRRQQSGERAVFTNGCFDILHLGHIRYLQEARNLGDLLILGLNSDESIRQIKGPNRPLVPHAERAEILVALTCSHYITIFPEPTASPLIDLLQPAIYVKGADYAHSPAEAISSVGAVPSAGPIQSPDTNRLPEAKHVLAYGGTIRL